jgi:hypothetical protein
VRQLYALVVVVGCVTSRETLVRQLEQRHGCTGAIRVTSLGFDGETGMEILRADSCGASAFYRCWSHPRSVRSCCETLGDEVGSRGARFRDEICGD